MQATTTSETKLEKRYSPSFRDDPIRRQSSTKRKRDEVLRLVENLIFTRNIIEIKLIALKFGLAPLFLLTL